MIERPQYEEPKSEGREEGLAKRGPGCFEPTKGMTKAFLKRGLFKGSLKGMTKAFTKRPLKEGPAL